MDKKTRYEETLQRIYAVCEGESDPVALMATIVCELHHAFDYYDWTGFYRTVAPKVLKIGPYQGGHGCLDIAFERGICGAAAREKKTQLVADVHAREDHIACASTTNSEIVVPVFNDAGETVAVLDVASDQYDSFCTIDQHYLEELCGYFGKLVGQREFL